MRFTPRRVENSVLIAIVILATAGLMTMLYRAGHDYGLVEGYHERTREKIIESEVTEL